MTARHFLGRLTAWIVLIGLSAILNISIAEGAESKFHPASGLDPVIGHYLVTLDSSVADAGSTAEALARSYGGQIEGSVSPDARTFAVTMLPSRARTLSADPRVREVVEIAQPDARETPPVAPRRASLTSPHLVPHQLSTSGTYTYDGSGNIKGIGTDSSFVYDVEGRLVDATVQSNQQTYTYDIYGNRLSATRANGAIGCVGNTTCEAPVTMSETPSTTNHLAGVTYDATGNVTQGYDATYAYDGTGMMTKATVGTDVRDFVYTADDERIAVKQGLSWTWSVRDQGGKVLREFTSLETSNPFALSAHTWTKDYVWREGQLLASTSIPAGSSSPVTYHYHLGTPRMITRDGGIVVSNHNYYPFGSEMDQPSQESPAEAMKFTGHERDTFAGSNHSVDYMHARHYNGNLGRFLSRDKGAPAPEVPQSWNRYSYARNNPVTLLDPDGKDAFAAWIMGLVGGPAVAERYRHVSTLGAVFGHTTQLSQAYKDTPRIFKLETEVTLGILSFAKGPVARIAGSLLGYARSAVVDNWMDLNKARIDDKLGRKLGTGDLPFEPSKDGANQARDAIRNTLNDPEAVKSNPFETRGGNVVTDIYSAKTDMTVRIRDDGTFDTLIGGQTSKVQDALPPVGNQ